ncbi:ImmA/IrrE family metallo-endopeptidase [Sorangium sp. So ce1153]|uniref:ImmA/IrrE family metallo-endopeptidase n=1 Tax=Sorangium sp. So ce1153 TaxID=3133333 RepID=UPI003F644224
MVDFAAVGRRLRAAREARHLERATLARDAHVSEDVLARLEAGEAVPVSTAALARVERRLKLTPTALWADTPREETALSLHFRHASVPDFFSADEAAAREALMIARDVEGLEERLGRPAPLKRADWFREAQVGHNASADGYARAWRLRDILHQKNLLDSPTAPLPDPLETLVEEAFGVPVVEKPLHSSSVLAVTVKDRVSGLAAILLNTASEWGTHLPRSRVDLAHEVCHLLYDEPREDIGLWIDVIEDQEDDAPRRQGDAVEKRARAFAAELLLPKLGLHQLLGRPLVRARELTPAVEMVRRAREHYGTTIELTSYHLYNVGYIEKYLLEEIQKTVPSLSHAAPSARETLLSRRVREALSAGLISAMRARELLDISAWDELPWSTTQ